MIAASVVQEGEVLLECNRPAAGAFANLTAPLEACSHHVVHSDVVVVTVFCAFAAAVVQHHRLIAFIAETQFTHSHLQLLQNAGLRAPGSFSPSGLALARAPALSFPVQKFPDHMLKLAFCEALEHHGD